MHIVESIIPSGAPHFVQRLASRARSYDTLAVSRRLSRHVAHSWPDLATGLPQSVQTPDTLREL